MAISKDYDFTEALKRVAPLKDIEEMAQPHKLYGLMDRAKKRANTELLNEDLKYGVIKITPGMRASMHPHQREYLGSWMDEPEPAGAVYDCERMTLEQALENSATAKAKDVTPGWRPSYSEEGGY